MKFKELSKLEHDEIAKKLNELELELMKLNAQVAVGTAPKSTKQIREIKRNIARIHTLREQKVEKVKKAQKYSSLLKNSL
jgi:ribosomal protein L29